MDLEFLETEDLGDQKLGFNRQADAGRRAPKSRELLTTRQLGSWGQAAPLRDPRLDYGPRPSRSDGIRAQSSLSHKQSCRQSNP